MSSLSVQIYGSHPKGPERLNEHIELVAQDGTSALTRERRRSHGVGAIADRVDIQT
jgi:hypothetical protein